MLQSIGKIELKYTQTLQMDMPCVQYANEFPLKVLKQRSDFYIGNNK